MVNLGKLNPKSIISKIEQKAPTLGTFYGILSPFVATQTGDESAIDAIMREITALTNPQMPTISGIVGWWRNYAQDTAKNGLLVMLAGEILGKPRWSKAGMNILQGTAISAIIGEVGGGGGAPYPREGKIMNQPPAGNTPNMSIGGSM